MVTNRSIYKTFLFLFYFIFVSQSMHTYAVDPLLSWNEGQIKNAIIRFVKEVTDEKSEYFIPEADRIATFDEDGTLWVEQPIYTEFFFVLETIKSTASQHPEWNNREPFKSILAGNTEILHHLSKEDLAEMIAVTHSGMTLENFHKKVSDWLDKATHPQFKRPFIQLVYQPMIEMMQFLNQNGFTVYIVSGGGQEFIRAFAEKLYNIPPNRVIGSAGKVKYDYRNGQPVLIKLPEIMFIDDKAGKPEGINLVIGKRPVLAFGNSTGDRQMLEYTQGNKNKNLEILVHHDDAFREYAYGPNSKVGTFSIDLMDEAKKRGWLVVSMKNDWKIIFPWERKDQEENNQTLESESILIIPK